jgi:hypothetical protein
VKTINGPHLLLRWKQLKTVREQFLGQFGLGQPAPSSSRMPY